MPRCHRNGHHYSGNHNIYLPNYSVKHDKNGLYKQNSKEILYLPSHQDTHFWHSKQTNLNILSNQGMRNNVELKIEDIKIKIKEEIKSRKNIIRNNISKEEICFECQEGEIYRLKRGFLDFILKEIKFGFLKRRNLKNDLKILRFNFNEGLEDMLISDKTNFVFRSDSLRSVLKVKSLEWKKWEDMIKLIGIKISDYKLSIKEKELDQLYYEYKGLSLPESKEKLKICEKCGLENNWKAHYCYYCGNKF